MHASSIDIDVQHAVQAFFDAHEDGHVYVYMCSMVKDGLSAHAVHALSCE